MRVELELWGIVLRLTLGPDGDGPPSGPGDVTTYPVGFAPHPDTRYERVPGGDVG